MNTGLMLFLTVILTVFLLVGGEAAWTGLTRCLPPWWRERIKSEVPPRLVTFVHGQVAIAAGFAFILVITFTLIDVPSGALWGILIGMARMITFMGAVAQVGVSLLLLAKDVGTGLTVFGVAFVLGQIVDNVVVPRVMGNLVGLNPLWLLFIVFLGAKVAGLPGILVSIPIASTIREIADEWRATQGTHGLSTLSTAPISSG